MAEAKEPAAGDLNAPSEPAQEHGAPFLSASFFSKLVHQPSCITKGVCDNCGRCEH